MKSKVAVVQFEAKNVQKIEAWALITRRVYDAFGRDDNEEFVDLLPVDQAKEKSSRTRGFVRLVAVQFPLPLAVPKPDTFDKLKIWLFPERNKTAAEDRWNDAKARIVQISPRISIVPHELIQNR